MGVCSVNFGNLTSSSSRDLQLPNGYQSIDYGGCCCRFGVSPGFPMITLGNHSTITNLDGDTPWFETKNVFCQAFHRRGLVMCV